MPRNIEVSIPAEQANAILERLRNVDGIVGWARYPGASLQPPGDVLSIQATSEGTRQVVALLEDCEATRLASIRTSGLSSLISAKHQTAINAESNETIWDEMAFMLRGDTNPSANFFVGMSLAGAIATAGLWSDTLHIIIGAMIVAPGFEPLARLPFALISGAYDLIRGGVLGTLGGYLMLAVGAALTAGILALSQPEVIHTLTHQQWVQYWSQITFPGVVSSILAGTAGAVLISGQRSVLTTGVMISLALIPSMALVGLGLSIGDISLAAKGFMHWALDVTLVIVMSAIVFAVKKHVLHRRRALS
jgi:hypothetical protein